VDNKTKYVLTRFDLGISLDFRFIDNVWSKCRY